MNLAKLAVRFPVTVLMLFLGVMLLGVISFRGLNIDLLPDINSPKIVVSVKSQDKSPSEMEKSYSERIEALIATIPKVKRVTSISRVGRTIVTVEFDWNADMDFALLDVQKKVSQFAGDREVEEVSVNQFDPRALPILTLAMRGKEDIDLEEVRRIAENTVKRTLERLDGVAAARVSGGIERDIVVRLDPYLLEAYGLTAPDIAAKLRAANMDASGGNVDDREMTYVIKGKGRYSSIEEIASTTVGYRNPTTPATGRANPAAGSEKIPVYLRDVGHVGLEPKEPINLVHFDSKRSVGIAIHKEARGNTVKVIDEVMEELADLRRDLRDYEIAVASNQGTFIRNSIDDVKRTAIYGILLAVIVLYLFLRHFRTTTIVSLAIPISIVVTFNLMYFGGLTLNIMSLGGLALGAGMMVDNAIVVVESIFRHRQQSNRDAKEAAVRGTAEVATAIAAATLTTVVVFVPIVFVHGVSAALFREQALTVTFALLSSLVVAMLVIPVAAARFLGEGKAIDSGRGILAKGYVRWLDVCLKKPVLVIGAVFATVALAAGMAFYLDFEFIPKSDQDDFTLKVKLTPGTRIERTEETITGIEQILFDAGKQVVKQHPPKLPLLANLFGRAQAGTPDNLIEHIYSHIGVEEEEGLVVQEEVSDSNTAMIFVRLVPADRRGVTTEEFVAAVAPILESLPGVEMNYLLHETTLQLILGTGESPVAAEIRGPFFDALERIGGEVEESMRQTPGLYNIASSLEEGRPQVSIQLDRIVAGQFGLSLQDVVNQVRLRVKGENVGDFEDLEKIRDMEIKFEDMNLAELRKLPIDNPVGAEIQLEDIAQVHLRDAAKEIRRRDQSRVCVVTADLVQGFSYGKTIGQMRESLASIPLPGEYRISLVGEERERRESFRNLTFALILAIILVYMVLASLFESLMQPFIIMLTVPLAAIGVVFGFTILERPLSIMAYIGIIMLAGIAVNNAIVMVDYINRLRAEGCDTLEAIRRGAATRLRPILMTSSTTVLALLPLSMGVGEGASLRSPMAIAVICGLVSSTLLTLFFVPVAYRLLDRFKKAFSTQARALQE